MVDHQFAIKGFEVILNASMDEHESWSGALTSIISGM